MNVILVAWDDNRLIGNGIQLPWHIRDDMKMFKERTLGHAIVMGRKTWDSLPIKPLPERENIVVSRSLDCKMLPDGAVSHPDLVAALEIAHLAVEDKSDIFIIGGAQIYAEVLDKNLVDKMIVTKVHGSHEGDVYFPSFEESEWDVEILSSHELFEVLEYSKK